MRSAGTIVALGAKLAPMNSTGFKTLKAAVEWRVSHAPVPYAEAVAAMETRVTAIAGEQAAEQVWLLEHPPIYTAGTSAKTEDLIQPSRFPVHATGRGGQLTYHGPGQRIAYVMLNLKARGGDVRAFVQHLEGWIIDVLGEFGVAASVREGRVGVWVDRPQPDGTTREEKIAALGIRVRRGVSFHGVSLNVDPDLSHFSGIIPCGLPEFGVTSLAALGVSAAMTDIDQALHRQFVHRFEHREPALCSSHP